MNDANWISRSLPVGRCRNRQLGGFEKDREKNREEDRAVAVYVDELKDYRQMAAIREYRAGRRHGHRWCHLAADTENELHEFAAKLGLKRSWFRGAEKGRPHYDLLPGRRTRAIAMGAIAIARRDMVRHFRQLQGRPDGAGL